MNNKKQIEKYMNKVNKLLCSNYILKLEIHEEDINNNTTADIAMLYNYKSAIIRIYPNFFKYSTEEKERVIIHEILHSITGFWHGAVNELEHSSAISHTLFALTYNRIKHDEETCIELLTRAIHKLIK